MYRNCIYCAGDLGSNDALERFPVGRSVAFDGERGRLWAVCPRCARWNLAPLEERWEAIDDAERLLRDTRTRVQRENIGLAKLPDGTRLVRVGSALAGELAAWRYGETLARRRQRYLAEARLAVAGGGVAIAGAVLTAVSFTLLWHGQSVVRAAWNAAQRNRVVAHAEVSGTRLPLRLGELHSANLQVGPSGLELLPPGLGSRVPGVRRLSVGMHPPLVLEGATARTALGRGMVGINRRGGSRDQVRGALDAIGSAGGPEALLMQLARRRVMLTGARPVREEARWFATTREQVEQEPNPVTSLALEMALHEETERRALEGELAALEEMWRQAEEIAAIADRLPDDVPVSEPPRIGIAR